MNLFAIAGLSCGVSCLILAFIAMSYGKTKAHSLLVFFNIAVAIWGFGGCFVGIAKTPEAAMFGWKFAHIGGAFVAVFFYHLICVFCGIKINSALLKFGYVQATIFNCISWGLNLGITKVRYVYDLYYNVANFFVIFIILVYVLFIVLSFNELIKLYKHSSGNIRVQALYVILGFAIGFIGGTSTFLPEFRIDIFYPFGNLGIVIYCLIVTYAILKYNILDIKIAISRVGIFVVVYSIVLGIPYGLAIIGKTWLEKIFGGSWFWFPMNSLLILATAGPFIYIFLQKKTEKHLMQEEVRTQNLLLQASYGMNTIHDLDHLVNLVVEVVMKILRVNKAEIYLLNHEASQYELAAPKNSENKSVVINAQDSFIETLKDKKFPFVYDETRVLAQSENNRILYSQIEDRMKQISASIVVPIIINGTLLGFLTLGERKSKEMYSRDLLNALTVLGNQAALAIENCHYLEAETKRMEEEGVRERMVSLDHMASSMAHEIDNPNTVILNQADLIIEAMDRDPRTSIPEEIKKDIIGGLRYIQESSTRVSEMIRAVLEYSRMGTGQLKPIKIYDALESFEKLISPELKKTRVDIKKKIEKGLPFILGDKIQIEEIFMNLTTNALHAIKHKEGEKIIELKIFKKDDKFIRIEFSDNGYGIAKNMLSDIFLASVTTKGSVEGTGLGLYRVRKIVDKHKGKIWAESEGKDKGARFVIELPIHKEELSDIIKEENGKPIRTKKVF